MDKSDQIIQKIDDLAKSVDKRFDSVDKRFGELTDVVLFIKDRMVTKQELKEELDPIKDRLTAIEGKVGGVNNRIDQEVDARKVLEVQVAQLKASGAKHT